MVLQRKLALFCLDPHKSAAFPVEISIGAPCGALLDDDDDDDDDGAASVCLFGRG